MPAICVEAPVPTLTHTPDAELERLADTASEPACSLAAELLHVRRRVVKIGGLLAFYDENNVRQAWRITRNILAG